MKKETIYLSIIVAVIVTLSVTVSRSIFAAWTPPSSPAPSDNVESPINRSIDPQLKNGSLHIGVIAHGQEYGLQVINGVTWAKAGLQIEKRSSDPTSPKIGQIWIRD